MKGSGENWTFVRRNEMQNGFYTRSLCSCLFELFVAKSYFYPCIPVIPWSYNHLTQSVPIKNIKFFKLFSLGSLFFLCVLGVIGGRKTFWRSQFHFTFYFLLCFWSSIKNCLPLYIKVEQLAHFLPFLKIYFLFESSKPYQHWLWGI